MSRTEHIADVLGRKAMAERLGVGATAVSNAVVRGWFPPSWYFVIDKMCEGVGIECYPEMFRMKSPNDTTQTVDCEGGKCPQAAGGEK